jgi:hypothetical protein
MARTADCFYELIVQGMVPDGSHNGVVTAGTYADAKGHSWLVHYNTGYMVVTDTSLSVKISATSLDYLYLADPTYIAVWWDHANTKLRLYYRKIGESETVLSSANMAAGSSGSAQLWIGGNGSNIYSDEFKIHMFGMKRGALTEGHRSNVYDRMGI